MTNGFYPPCSLRKLSNLPSSENVMCMERQRRKLGLVSEPLSVSRRGGGGGGGGEGGSIAAENIA